MRLVTYCSSAGERPAVAVGDRLCPLQVAVDRAQLSESIDTLSVRRMLDTANRSHWQAIDKAAAHLVEENASVYPRLDAVALLPPVPDPQKILCLALNSKDHCREVGVPHPAIPWFFPKWPTSLTGHESIIHPASAITQLDWEGEVAVVIGKTAKCVSHDRAMDYVAGLTVLNDLSARNLIHGIETIAVTKAGDWQAPCGPALVTLDEVSDIRGLRYRTLVNGSVKQDGTTDDYIFSVDDAIASITRVITLVPGDIISMGTLPGVGLCRSPQEFLSEGDVIDVEVERVGTLRTTIGAASDVAHPAPSAGDPGRESR